MKTISVVVPAFNEEDCIPQLAQQIESTFSKLEYNFELIIVDDGSSDRTFMVIKELISRYPFMKGIKLSRNMGHQAALDCGLNHAKGDAIICMDADLQHPPRIALDMIKYWEDGYDIVTTIKKTNTDASIIYKLYARIFYYVFNKFSQIKLTPNSSDFRLMSRRTVQALLSMPEYHKFYRGMIHFIGFKSTTIYFDVEERFAGKRKYTFGKSLNLASAGLFSFSDFALKVPFYLGTVLIIILLLHLIYNVIGLIFFDFQFERGWTSLILVNFLSLGIILIFLGTIGLYIGKIFFEVKRRPIYFTEEYAGDFNKEEH